MVLDAIFYPGLFRIAFGMRRALDSGMMKIRFFAMMVPVFLVVSVVSRADVAVEPAGMKIVWKSLKKEFDGFQTYNTSEGVYVTLAVRGGDKGIIKFDKDKSKVSVSDGTSDLEGKFGMWNKISKDGKAMRVEVQTEKLPAVTAATLKLDGKLEVMVASKTETRATEAQEFKKGDKVELKDGFKFKITKIGKPKWGDDPLSVTLEWKRKVPELAAVRFFDAGGKEIKSSAGGSSWGGLMGNYTVAKTYNLKSKADVLKIEMDLWVDVETITVPVNLVVGPGGAR